MGPPKSSPKLFVAAGVNQTLSATEGSATEPPHSAIHSAEVTTTALPISVPVHSVAMLFVTL